MCCDVTARGERFLPLPAKRSLSSPVRLAAADSFALPPRARRRTSSPITVTGRCSHLTRASLHQLQLVW
ncbi:hypothetical protein JOQ06_028809 [Pogonophryne albipinna]|uniref:Uncharacterized protein n=1 Tax=Pogonophryne albipinna TaxID=1090488 RepID=A0AAD6FL26_9TELE|nr:hypothetical protein JOQ06_028809 [Pogonophryne albipinna]